MNLLASFLMHTNEIDFLIDDSRYGDEAKLSATASCTLFNEYP